MAPTSATLATPRVAAKLSPPQRGDADIPRIGVCERMAAADAAPLVVLCAPAGFGKTTALLQLRDQFTRQGLACAWLTLDRADNDTGRFLCGLALALSGVIPDPEGESARGGMPDGIALALMDRMAAHDQPFALFLDEFEALQNPAVLAIIGELVEQLPLGARLFIASRSRPDFGVGRMRAHGRMLEITAAQLRFSTDETATFLSQRGLALNPSQSRRLYENTEGWPAALGLASISLRENQDPDRFIDAFSGSHAAVVDYLTEDVLARQPPEVREFLLRTSILGELNAPLCDALLGGHESTRILRQLDRAHLFLIPLQGDAGQYRYHSMFAEFLRGELGRQYGDELPRLHGSAACWYEQQGRHVPAIEHMLAAGDRASALRLLGDHAQALLDQGRVQLLSRWLDPLLKAGELEGFPMLQIVHAWATLFARGPLAVEEYLQRIERAAHPDAELQANRTALRAMVLALTDRTEEALQIASGLQANLAGQLPFVGSLLEVTLANLALIAGRYQDALRLTDEARARQAYPSSSFNFAISQAVEAGVDLTQGRLRKALAGLRIAAGAGTALTVRSTNGNALAGVPLAEALYESGQIDASERLLAVHIPLIRRVAIPDELIIAHVVMSRILMLRGNCERALLLLRELEEIGHRSGLPRVLASARLEQVRLLLLEDQVARAREELARCGDPALWDRVARLSHRANEVENRDVAWVRWLIRAGKTQDAIALLRPELDAAERAHRMRRALTLRLLYAQALHKGQQRNKGLRGLASVVRTAALEGYVRPLLDEGPAVVAMLHELRTCGDLLAGEGQDATAFVDRLLNRPGEGAPAAPAAAGPAQSDLLTRKELRVLTLAAEGFSNDELADKLFVAETTVRTHLRNINMKLDTRSRVEAIAAARRLRLIG